MAEVVETLEVFKIGRMRVVFPPDITDDELQFMSMMIYSYIQNVKYRSSPNWRVSERLEEKDKNKKRGDGSAGVS